VYLILDTFHFVSAQTLSPVNKFKPCHFKRNLDSCHCKLCHKKISSKLSLTLITSNLFTTYFEHCPIELGSFELGSFELGSFELDHLIEEVLKKLLKWRQHLIIFLKHFEEEKQRMTNHSSEGWYTNFEWNFFLT